MPVTVSQLNFLLFLQVVHPAPQSYPQTLMYFKAVLGEGVKEKGWLSLNGSLFISFSSFSPFLSSIMVQELA